MANRLSAAQKRRRKNCSLKPLLSLFIKPKKNTKICCKKRGDLEREHKKVKLLKAAAAHAPHHLLNEWEYRREFLRQNCFDFLPLSFAWNLNSHMMPFMWPIVCFKWEFYAQNIRFQFSIHTECAVRKLFTRAKKHIEKFLRFFHSLSSFILWETSVKFPFVNVKNEIMGIVFVSIKWRRKEFLLVK